MGEHGVDGHADVLPVHLRRVALSAVGTEEHRVREAGVIVNVREAGQREREPGADQLA